MIDGPILIIPQSLASFIRIHFLPFRQHPFGIRLLGLKLNRHIHSRGMLVSKVGSQSGVPIDQS
jgi:hypothetical protein